MSSPLDTVRKRGLKQERKEHLTLPAKTVAVLVDDHISRYGKRAYPPKR
jgi:hypothetical protein